MGQPLLRRTLSLQMHEPLRQRIAVQYHLEGLSREELDAYLAHQLKAAGVTQPLFDDTARQALYQATKGILRKVNKLALTALRLAASRKASTVGGIDPAGCHHGGAAVSDAASKKSASPAVLSLAQLLEQQPASGAGLSGGTGTVASAGYPVCRRRAQGGQVAAGRQPRLIAGGRRGPHRVFHPRCRAAS